MTSKEYGLGLDRPITSVMMYSRSLLISYTSYVCHLLNKALGKLLGWPKRLFGFYCKMLWKNWNKPFAPPTI